MIFYHVVTDRPMSVGQHIVFDGEHRSGVWQRVQAKLPEVREIYREPEKYAGAALEHHTDVALRELALEKVRLEKYPQYPSRLASLYVSKTYEEAEKWADYFVSLGRPTFCIVKLEVNGRCFEGDAYKCFDGTPSEEENLRLAEIYWRNGENEDGHPPITEVLVDGDILVAGIMKEIGANLPASP